MEMHREKEFKSRFSVITCSSSMTEENDESGRIIKELINGTKHSVVNYAVVKDDKKSIVEKAKYFLTSSDALVISGGTGLTKNDVTIEAISSISEFEITAFSTIFSLLSYEEIGTSAIMSRSSAFVVDRKPVFCLPGSPKAAELGVKKIVLEQIDHIHHELNR